MTVVTFKGQPVALVGNLPSVGSKAPAFKLVRKDLSDATLSDFSGKKLILSIFPSVDTSVCALAVKRFYTLLANHPDIQVLNISIDLPFALGRFCSAEALPTAQTLSAFRSSFGQDYGIAIAEGKLETFLARAVLIIDEQGTVSYSQLVPEITNEPDYSQVLSALGLPLPTSH